MVKKILAQFCVYSLFISCTTMNNHSIKGKLIKLDSLNYLDVSSIQSSKGGKIIFSSIIDKIGDDYSTYRTVLSEYDNSNHTFSSIGTISGKNYKSYSNEYDTFFINQVFKKDFLEDEETIIYKLSDKGEIIRLSNIGNSYLKFIYFNTELEGFIVSREKGVYYINKTIDGGKSWNRLTKLERFVGNSFLIRKEKLYYLSSENNNLNNRIKSLDLKTLQTTEFKYLDGFSCEKFQIDASNSLIIFGKENNSTKLKIFNFETDTWEDDFQIDKLLPYDMYISKEFKVIITNQVNESLLGGFGGTEYQMFVKNKNEQEWTTIELPDKTYIKPYSLNSKSFIGYSGDNKITLVKWKLDIIPARPK
ncbi:MAG: hypothetical protein ACK5MD_05660 [Flavobacteriales bacterium]